MMSQIDRARSQSLLRAAGLDALALFQPENFRYATSVAAGVATMWGRAGSAIALVPADEKAKLGVVISDHAYAAAAHLGDRIDFRTHRIWIDMVTVENARTIEDINVAYRQANNVGPRAETFDQDAAFRLLGDLLAERGLSKARIGVDLEFMPAADFAALKKHFHRLIGRMLPFSSSACALSRMPAKSNICEMQPIMQKAGWKIC